MAFVALNLDVWDRTHSGSWIAALLIADFLPAIAIGLHGRAARRPALAQARDGRGRRRALPRLLHAPVRGERRRRSSRSRRSPGFATGFFRPAVYAGLPNLVEDHELPSAQGLLQAADAVTTVLGPLDRRRPRRRDEPGLGLRGERDHVPLLGRAHPPHPDAPAPGRPGEHRGALARHRGRPAPDRLARARS